MYIKLLFYYHLGFSNPPGNFTCQAIDQSSDVTKPSVILTWERPTFQAFFLNQDGYLTVPETGNYEVVYEANGEMHTVTVDIGAEVNNIALIDLQEDDEYTFYVYFSRREYSRRAISQPCTVDTNTRRSKI